MKKTPIFYHGKSPKSNIKYLKIPHLQVLTLGHFKKLHCKIFKTPSTFCIPLFWRHPVYFQYLQFNKYKYQSYVLIENKSRKETLR